MKEAPKNKNRKLLTSLVVLITALVLYQFVMHMMGAIQHDKSDIIAFNDHYNKGNAPGAKVNEQASTADIFYNIVTDFYEWGWGPSFHFATRHSQETFRESLRRHEFYLSSKLGLKAGMKVLDMGSGVGGPMRNIGKFSGANITALTINKYQVSRCKHLTGAQMLDKLMHCVQGDFTNLSYTQNHFDAIYAIESTCHVIPRRIPFSEAFRVLKPGGLFAAYEWGMTTNYNGNSTIEADIKRRIEYGNSLPELPFLSEILAEMKHVGFEIVEEEDLASRAEKLYGKENIPWYWPLTSKDWSLETVHTTSVGRAVATGFLNVAETVGLVPKGSLDAQKMLQTAADSLIEGGERKIFTPLYFILARKPFNNGTKA